MFINLVVVLFLNFDLFILIELCCRYEMLLTNFINNCYNGVILLKFLIIFEFFLIFLGFIWVFKGLCIICTPSV